MSRVRTSFAVGYHQIHPDVSLNYQMNRFSTGSQDMIAEMRRVVPVARAKRCGLLTLGAARLVNDVVERAMRRSLVVQWVESGSQVG